MSHPSQPFKSIALIGATSAFLGPELVTAFLTNPKFKVELRVLHRASALEDGRKKQLLDKFVAQGATLVAVDPKSVDSLAAGLKGIDVAISALGPEGVFDGSERTFVLAAKQAGARRVVPSQWGIVTPSLPAGKMPFFDAKAGIVELIKSLGLEWTSFVTNTWLEFAVGPFLGFDLKEGKVNVAGSGDWRFSVTSFKDVAVLASNAIQHPDATNNYVYFSANTISWNDLIAIVERAFGRKFERTTRTQEQLQVLIASIPESQGLVRLGLSLQELYAFYNENVDTGSKAFEKKHPEFFAGIKLLTAEEYAHALAKAQTN